MSKQASDRERDGWAQLDADNAGFAARHTETCTELNDRRAQEICICDPSHPRYDAECAANYDEHDDTNAAYIPAVPPSFPRATVRRVRWGS